MGNNNIKLITFAIVTLLSISSVLALGVSSPYWKNNPLEISPGETKEVSFTLTNSPTAETATAFVNLVDGAGVAEIISGKEYTVTPGTTSTKVILKMSVPETAIVGTTYEVKFSVKGAPSDEEGTVQLIMGYNVDFPVKVVEQSQEQPEESTGTSWIFWVIIIAIIILIAYFFFKSNKKKK